MPRQPKEKKTIEPFWTELVSIYFDFCRNKFNSNPSFDGSAPRDLKAIIKQLHDRAVNSGIEWDLEIATRRFYNFLNFAYQDYWLKNNWLLSNLNRQKDRIFFQIRAAINKQSINPFE